MDDKKPGDDLYPVEDSDVDELYAKELSLAKPTEKLPDATTSDEPKKNSAAQKTFRSKHFTDAQDENSDKPKRKRRFSHAETSGIAISTVMMIYSLTTQDKPLFFVSAALITSLLRPLIGALFGKHNAAVQNALHTFSLVLFIGALIMLFV